MSVRHKLNGPIGIGAAVGLVLIALLYVFVFANFGNERQLTEAEFFYDIQQKRLFTARPTPWTPIDAPSGAKNGVKAYVYSCGECSDKDKRFIAFLEMYTDEALKSVIDGSISHEERSQLQGEGWRIRKVDDQDWMQGTTKEARQMMRDASRCPDGKEAQRCRPEPGEVIR